MATAMRRGGTVGLGLTLIGGAVSTIREPAILFALALVGVLLLVLPNRA